MIGRVLALVYLCERYFSIFWEGILEKSIEDLDVVFCDRDGRRGRIGKNFFFLGVIFVFSCFFRIRKTIFCFRL